MDDNLSETLIEIKEEEMIFSFERNDTTSYTSTKNSPPVKKEVILGRYRKKEDEFLCENQKAEIFGGCAWLGEGATVWAPSQVV